MDCRTLIAAALLCASCSSQVKVPPLPIKVAQVESQDEEKKTCDVESTGYVARQFHSSYERYNEKDGIPLYCVPAENAALADTLYTLSRLDILEHGDVDSVSWCRALTHKYPQKSGWIRSTDFSNKVVQANSRLTFVGRMIPPPNEYYEGHAELYSVVNSRVKDTITLDKTNGDHFQLSLIETHSLDNVEYLIRYESHTFDSKENYYQDIIAYTGGRFVPLVFTDKSVELGGMANTEEYTIYFPYILSNGELILAPLFENRGRLTEQEMIDKQFHFTEDISIPKEQCVIKFFEIADNKGKLMQRSTEVYHWNGADLARMYGSDFNFKETELK